MLGKSIRAFFSESCMVAIHPWLLVYLQVSLSEILYCFTKQYGMSLEQRRWWSVVRPTNMLLKVQDFLVKWWPTWSRHSTSITIIKTLASWSSMRWHLLPGKQKLLIRLIRNPTTIMLLTGKNVWCINLVNQGGRSLYHLHRRRHLLFLQQKSLWSRSRNQIMPKWSKSPNMFQDVDTVKEI